MSRIANLDPSSRGKQAGPRPGKTLNASAESQLLARIAQSDRGAFAELFDRTAPRLYAILLRRGTSRREADTILQDVFLKLWQDRGQSISSGHQTLIRLVETAVRLARDGRSPGEMPRSDVPGSAVPIGNSVEDDLRHVAAPRPREILKAIYLDGRTVSQLAAHYGLSSEALRETVVDAMKELRCELKQREAEK